MKKIRKKGLRVYKNLTQKSRSRRDHHLRKKAERKAKMPKHPVKRFLYWLNPVQQAKYWFSAEGRVRALKIFGIAILFAVLLVGALFAYYRKDLDALRPSELARRVQSTVTKYYDRNDKLLWEDKGQGDYTLVVDGDKISKYMKQATIAIEDKEFYSHSGISISGLTRALFSNVRGNATQGGSTLTQQLVKQVYFSDEAQKRGLAGIPRKIKEIILAIEVERMYNKDQILNLYLNQSPYGGRRNGVESAAQTYFSKAAVDLNLAESALLASIPNQPGLYDPYNLDGHEPLIARQHKTLDSMVEMGFVTAEEAAKAKKEPVLDRLEPLSSQFKGIKAPHFVFMVRNQLEKELGKATVGRGGLTVKTTVDIRIQKKLEESMSNMFKSYIPDYAGFTNGAATVEDTKTGQIVALLGSRDFNYAGFGENNAATAYIQPGSTIKPLVFAELFGNKGAGKQNFGSGTILPDDKSMDKIYGAPLQNFDGKYRGNISIRKSLALSRNIPAIKAMYISGVQPTWETIRALGNEGYCTQGQEVQAGLSSAIGSCGSKQIELVNAYASLARMGVYKPYSTVLEVKNAQGQVLKTFKDESKQVIDPQVAYIVSDILSDDNARAGLHGRNVYGLVVPGVKTAVKTGTSDKGGKPKDLWSVSYSPVLSMGVWVGNSDTKVLRNGNSAIPARIIGDVMQYAHKEVYQAENKWSPGDWFSAPSGIKRIGGELFPAWYDKRYQANKKMIFDSVSKKLATECTPDSAKVEISVLSFKDAATGKEVISAKDGYDASSKDDVHNCGDVQPSVSIGADIDGSTITITVTNGTYTANNLVVSVNGSTIDSREINGSGTYIIDNSDNNTPGDFTVKATVRDEAKYTGSGTLSGTW